MQASTEFYRTLLAQDATLFAVRADLARGLLDACDLEGAIAEASVALDQAPHLTQALLVRAAARKALCDHSLAAADLERATALAPLRPMILVDLATCYAELDCLDLAEDRLRRALGLDPHCTPAHANLGSVLVRQGREADAAACCRAALTLDPGLIAAHQNLSGILAACDPAAARAHREAAYGRQQIFVEPAVRPELAVLVLAAADAANVPLAHLLPRARITVIRWYVECAPPGQERALPHHDCIFNAIGDPDLAPEIGPHVLKLLRDETGLVLNHPACVARTRRSDLPQLLAGLADVFVPPVIRMNAASGRPPPMPFPVLVRPIGSHGGEGARKVDDPAAWTTVADSACYVTRFVDFRSADGWHRKYRAIFVDGRPYPCHLAIGPGWLVHYWTAGMQGDPARRDEERRFLDDPKAAIGARAWTALAAIAARLGLDYGGIDFAMMPDGRVLVFEANATMLVHPEHDPRLDYRNPAVGVIQSAFAVMLRDRASRRDRG